MTREEEIERLIAQPLDSNPPRGKLVCQFNVHCTGDASLVLRRAKEVLLTILQQNPWPSIDEWRRRLPAWFVERSAAEISQADASGKLNFFFRKRRRNRRWSVGSFVFWFTPGERAWFWWSAKIENPDLFQVEVIAIDLPFPWESLDWLLRASGALSVEEV